jgi:hypothetical protein
LAGEEAPSVGRAIVATTTCFRLPTVPLAQPDLRLPGDRPHCFGDRVDGGQPIARNAVREAVAVETAKPRGFDQQGSSINVTGLGESAEPRTVLKKPPISPNNPPAIRINPPQIKAYP